MFFTRSVFSSDNSFPLRFKLGAQLYKKSTHLIQIIIGPFSSGPNLRAKDERAARIRLALWTHRIWGALNILNLLIQKPPN